MRSTQRMLLALALASCAAVLSQLYAHFVYLVRARDNSLYCGYARNPSARVVLHNAGRGARILRGKLPVRLVYLRRFRTRSAALKYEIALKQKTHAYKVALSLRWRKGKHNTTRRTA